MTAPVNLLAEARRHVEAAIEALMADGDQVEAMHQLQQIEVVLDRMAVVM